MHEREPRMGVGVGWGWGGDVCICSHLQLVSKKEQKNQAAMFLDTCSKASWQLPAMVIQAGSGSGDLRCYPAALIVPQVSGTATWLRPTERPRLTQTCPPLTRARRISQSAIFGRQHRSSIKDRPAAGPRGLLKQTTFVIS